MANFYRLILSAFFLFASTAASAFPPNYLWSIGSAPATYATPGAACSSAGLSLGGLLFPNEAGGVITGYKCINAQGDHYNSTGRGGPTCPAGSTVSGSGEAASCTCNAGSTEFGGTCVPDTPDGQCTANAERVNGVCMCKVGFKEGLGVCQFDKKGQCEAFEAIEGTFGGLLGREIALVGRVNDGAVFCMPLSSDPAKMASAGCSVKFSQQMVATNPDGSTTSYGGWDMGTPSATDSRDFSCSTAEPVPPKQPDAPTCPNGSPGTVNGVQVCVPRQPNNGVETGGTDSTTVNDGTNTTETENNSTTVCKDGKCTTTTVTTTTVTNNTSGSSTTSSTTSATTASQGDFCAKNPSNAQCNGTGTGGNGEGDGKEEPSQFGGACAAGFTCKGDAIQCAIAHEQHKRACRLFDDPSPESQLYLANKGKEGNQTTDLPGNETVNVAGRIDSSDALGAGSSGVSDLNVTVWGKAVTLPFSMVNPYLAALGNVLLAVSFLLALRIVARG